MITSPITPWKTGVSNNGGGGASKPQSRVESTNDSPHPVTGGTLIGSWFGHRTQLTDRMTERVCLKLKDSLHPKVRMLLPGPSDILQYPLHIVSTRSALSNLIPRTPRTATYVEIKLNPIQRFKRHNVFKTTEDGENKEERRLSIHSPGRRWLELASPGFLKIVEQVTTSNHSRVAISRVQSTEAEIQSLSTCAAIRHLYQLYGLRGFYKGFLSSHNTNLITEGLVTALTPPTEKLFQTWALQRPGVKEAEISAMSTRNAFWTKFFSWYRSEQGILMSAMFSASLLASTITYPLSTISLRQIVYEPLDGISVNFVDMARLTVLFDGPPSLFNGFGSYISAKLIQAVGTLCAQATASSLETKIVNSSPASIAILNQIKPALDVLTSPLTQYAQQSQALSRIPGLASSKPSFRSALGNLLSPAAIIETGANLVIILATYYSITQNT